MRAEKHIIVLCLLAPIVLGGCADKPDTQKGAAVGAVTGAVGGQNLGRSTSAT